VNNKTDQKTISTDWQRFNRSLEQLVKTDGFEFMTSPFMNHVIGGIKEHGGKFFSYGDKDIIEKQIVPIFTESPVLPFRISENSEQHLSQISLIIKYLGRDIKSVVELGAGYGNFSRCFDQFYDVQDYTIIDILNMLILCQRLLDFHKLKRTYLDVELDWSSKIPSEIDLFVSNYAYSETPRELQEKVEGIIIPRVKNVFITVDSRLIEDSDGDGSFSERDEKRLVGVLTKHFSEVYILNREKNHPAKFYIAKDKRDDKSSK